jgi:phage terminase large subunit-like protein
MGRERGLNISSLASLTPNQREAILDQLSEADALALLHDWRFLARPDQLAPEGDWRVWLILAGRGWGKTRTGAEWVRMQVETGAAKRIALVGRTESDAREVMIDGESGLLRIAPPWSRPRYIASRRRLVWANGAVGLAYSGDKPDQLRGPQHDAAWVDELAAFRFESSWHNLMMGLRLGAQPRVVVTTTPRPTRLIRMLASDPGTVVTHGTTFENAAHLAPSALAYLRRRYEGTRLGEQELNARLVTDVPGALWRQAWFEREGFRVRPAPELRRVVVAIDPAVSTQRASNETGIIVAGVGHDEHAYVLADGSVRGTPDEWAKMALVLYRAHYANQLIAEANNGGDLVAHTLRTIDRHVSVRLVHASRGKAVRAEPVAALYEQGRVHHVRVFGALEEQMISWTPESGESPDRMDALVWAIWALMIEHDTFTAADAPLTLGDWRG